MRADLANSNDDAIAPHEVGEGEGKGSAACRQAERSRRLACESRVIQVRRSARPATSTPRIGPSRTGLRSTGTGAGGGKRRRTALTRRARSPLAAFCQTLLSQRTGLTIRLVGQVDGSLGKGILLTHFAQPQAGPRWAAQPPVFLQHKGLCSQTSRGASKRLRPLPWSILLRRVFLSHEHGRCFFGGSPLHLT